MTYSRRGFLLSLAAAAGDYYPPPDSGGGWRTGSTLDRRILDQAFDLAQQSTRNGGLLVVHKGFLVYERYFGKGHREATPNLASCGKSFTSVAVGILMSERPKLFPEGLETRVFTPAYFPPEAFPLNDPRKAGIKLGQLLSMAAGIRGNNPGMVRGSEVTLNPAGPDGAEAMRDSTALATGLWCDPGAGYSYATSSIHMTSIVLRHVTGMELEEYVRSRIAGHLGWSRWGFAYKHARLGHTPGGGGIALRGTDMLRFLYLLLHEGNWAGKQVIPKEYVRHCGNQSPYNPHSPYSLQFDVGREGYWKSGSGGHALFVLPRHDLVAWKLGGRDSQYGSADTGLPEAPGSEENRYVRDGRWSAAIEPQPALSQTLQLLVKAAAA